MFIFLDYLEEWSSTNENFQSDSLPFISQNSQPQIQTFVKSSKCKESTSSLSAESSDSGCLPYSNEDVLQSQPKSQESVLFETPTTIPIYANLPYENLPFQYYQSMKQIQEDPETHIYAEPNFDVTLKLDKNIPVAPTFKNKTSEFSIFSDGCRENTIPTTYAPTKFPPKAQSMSPTQHHIYASLASQDARNGLNSQCTSYLCPEEESPYMEVYHEISPSYRKIKPKRISKQRPSSLIEGYDVLKLREELDEIVSNFMSPDSRSYSKNLPTVIPPYPSIVDETNLFYFNDGDLCETYL